MHPHATTYTLTRGLEEYDLEVEYSYHPGYPARGPSYSSGGEPSEPPEVEFDLPILLRTSLPFALTSSEADALYTWLIETHNPDDFGPDPDYAREMALEDARDRYYYEDD